MILMSKLKLELSKIDKNLLDFAEGKESFVIPDYRNLIIEPELQRTLIGKIKSKLKRFIILTLKNTISPYLYFKSVYDQRQEVRMTNIETEISNYKKILDQKYYETQKLVDGFKSEVLVEINRSNSQNSFEKVETSIINKDKVDNLNPLKLNVGCGRDIRSDHINIDNRELDGVDVVADVMSLPFESNSIDEIFASHLIEHFTERQLLDIVNYWYSLLKEGGSLILIAPNIEVMARDYASGKISWDNLRRIFLGGQDYIGDFHFNAFSIDYLKDFFSKAIPSAILDFKAIDRVNGECKEFELWVIKPK